MKLIDSMVWFIEKSEGIIQESDCQKFGLGTETFVKNYGLRTETFGMGRLLHFACLASFAVGDDGRSDSSHFRRISSMHERLSST